LAFWPIACMLSTEDESLYCLLSLATVGS
jgi:hypothetical protein